MTNTRNLAAVREPSTDDLAGLKDLDDIITWSGLKGDPSCAFSLPGSLLYLLAGDEYFTIDASEFASIAPDDYDEALRHWKYSLDERDMMRGDDPGLTISPTAIVKARARGAHRAA